MAKRKRKITDFFDKTEANSSNKSSSFGGNNDRLSETPSEAEYPGSKSICESSVKESSIHSRRGTHSNSSNTTGINAKRSYNLNDVNVVNENSKQSLKNSVTKNSAQKCKYSPNSVISNNKDINSGDEFLILTTFSKSKKTKISRRSQTILTSKNSFGETKSNIYLPE